LEGRDRAITRNLNPYLVYAQGGIRAAAARAIQDELNGTSTLAMDFAALVEPEKK
jgi:hypothetical protein